MDVYKNDSIVDSLDFMTASATREQIKKFRIRVGDTLITKDSETADDIGIAAFVEYEADDLVCGYHLAIVRPDLRRVLPKYLYWVLNSEPIARQWGVTAAGVTRVGIRSTELNKVTMPLPPLDEQQAIAEYLDHETAQTDALVAKQEEFIGLLRERRSRKREVLATRVANGQRLRWVLSEVDKRAGARGGDLPLMSVSINWGVRRRDETTDRLARAEDLSHYKICLAGDVIVNRMRAFQGALGVAPEDGVVSPDYAVLRATPEADPYWLAELMRTKAFVGEIILRLRGIGGTDSGNVRTPRINTVDLLDIRADVPEVTTQRAELQNLLIGNHRIDSLIAKAEEHIALAKERRSALVTAAVTGQIDVRAARKAS
ncbi:restriction endonuclease subunit S [Nocardiopsis dassonvillei]|uniref:restriction endonuclease subunit S n=1 Tax=Nocardiopsis dassonvillei TaxID=2014 RepID=UPI0020A609A4|nr:restriction endonuclease subunit S [Nocardiopsis dassonvillei]MCP3013051.1 restriction endonuclease subunit S [Nocardiopsis dassonvillei]